MVGRRMETLGWNSTTLLRLCNQQVRHTSREATSGKVRRTLLLSRIPPVAYFDEEDSLRLGGEEMTHVPTEMKVARVIEIHARLCPNKKKRGTRHVFPSQDGVPTKGFEVEIGISE